MLVYYFPDAVFTESVVTTPSNEKYSFPFRNVLALFYSELPSGEIIQKLKSIESAMGRQPRDKEMGKVIIDMDLIQYDNEILRPEDYQRIYVQELLTQLIG